MRNQLVGSLDVVRQRIESYVRDFDNAQHAFANGIPGVTLPPPPAPVGTPPPNCPYPFLMEVPKGTNPNMNPDLMRKGLGNSLGRAKEELHAFSQKLGDVLTEPAPVPGAPAAPGAPPMRHLPPDAKEAAGVPNTYLAIEAELEKALHDVMDRAQAWEEAQAADDTPSLGGGLLGMPFEKMRDLFADIEQRSHAEAEQVPLPQTTPEAQAPEPPQPSVEEQRAEAERLVKEYPPDKVLKDPRKLQALAQKLDEHQGQEAFSARFIEKFGAKKFLEVPRTLQAWEYRRVYVPGGQPPVHEKYLDPEKVRDEPKPGEVEGILYAFSATLATTSASDDLTEKQQDALDDIVKAKDALALSWLLTDNQHAFDKEFLLQSFEHVKKKIENEARDAANNMKRDDYATGPITGRDGERLSSDLKVGILNAISRSPEAALELTNMKFKPIEIPVFGKKPEKVDNPVDLLYRHGTYEDKGAALGRMMRTSHDQLQHLAGRAGRETEQGMASLTRANEITLRMAHEAAYGREQIDRIVVGLAPILAAQHMDDLQQSVLTSGGAQYGLGESVQEAAGQAFFVGKATADRVQLSGQQVEDILTSVCVDPEAERIFAEGLAKHQTKLISENLVQQKPTGEGAWAQKLGVLTGKFVNAAGNHAMGEFEAAEARRAQQLAIFDTVIELAPVVGKAIGSTAGAVVEGVLKYGTLPAADFEQLVKDIHFTAPSRDAVLSQIDNFKGELDQRLTASLGSIALETGMLGDRMAVKAEVEAGMWEQAKKDGADTIPTFFDQEGHLIKPSNLNDEQKAALSIWLHDDKVMRVLGPSLSDYKLAMLDEVKDR